MAIRGLKRVVGLHEELRAAGKECRLRVVALLLDSVSGIQVSLHPVSDPGGTRHHRQEIGHRPFSDEPPVGLQLKKAVVTQAAEADSGYAQSWCDVFLAYYSVLNG